MAAATAAAAIGNAYAKGHAAHEQAKGQKKQYEEQSRLAQQREAELSGAIASAEAQRNYLGQQGQGAYALALKSLAKAKAKDIPMIEQQYNQAAGRSADTSAQLFGRQQQLGTQRTQQQKLGIDYAAAAKALSRQAGKNWWNTSEMWTSALTAGLAGGATGAVTGMTLQESKPLTIEKEWEMYGEDPTNPYNKR